MHTPAEPTPLTQTPTMNPFLRHDCASHPTNSGSLLFSDVCRGFPYARVVTRIVRSPHPLRGSLPKLFAKSPHIPRNCGLQPLSRKVCTIKLSHSRGSLQAHLLLDQGVEKYNSFRSKCALRNCLTPGFTHKPNPSLRQRCASQPCSKDVAPPPLHLPTKEGHHRPRRGSRICLGLMFKLLGRTIAQRRM